MGHGFFLFVRRGTFLDRMDRINRMGKGTDARFRMQDAGSR